MTTTPWTDLWHRAGRAARDDRKRLACLYGVLVTPPALLLGVLAFRLADGQGADLGGLRRPLSYVVTPLRDAWRADADLSVLLYLLFAGLALACVWGLFGGAVSRMAAVQVSTGRKEPAGAAFAFARRHWRGFVGARAVLWAGAVVPVAAAILAASAGRLPGLAGELLLAPAVFVVAALVLAAVVLATLSAVAGFLAGPTVACEDSDAFDALSRVFAYAAAGVPRLVAVRLVFLGGVLLGFAWRALRTVAVLALARVAIGAGAGADRVDRVHRALAAYTDGQALPAGVTWGDAVAAGAVAVVVGGLAALLLADLVSRVLCARVAVYLHLRRVVDRVPVGVLRTPPRDPGRLDAEAAGFVEVSRVDAAGGRRRAT